MPGHTPWTGSTDDKLYLQSGQFSATLKTSLAVGTVDAAPSGISWDGTHTPVSGNTDNKLYLFSGQFSATLKTSLAVGTIDTGPTGIENTTRLAVASVVITKPLLLNTAVHRASRW